MQLETKYNIGHKFWVPRVFPVIQEEKLIHEGKEYVHRHTELQATAKPKIVVCIKIDVTEEGTRLQYGASDFNAATFYREQLGVFDHKLYYENELRFTSEKEALDFAVQMQNINRTYYGETTDN